jgi:hypothetical protein
MPIASSEPEYVEFKHNLGIGVHTVAWQFVKDASLSRGDDRAAIRVRICDICGDVTRRNIDELL